MAGMTDQLSLDNILDGDDIEGLFSDPGADEDKDEGKDNGSDGDTKEGDAPSEKDNAAEGPLDVESMFGKPEGVGGDEDDGKQGKEDAGTPEGDGASPNKSFYSSIATALREDGIFPDLDDEAIAAASDAETFRDLVDQQIRAGLDERRRQIDEVLSAGAEPSEVRRYEQVLGFLQSITDEMVSDEGERGEELRRRLIFQDLANRGYSRERAEKQLKRTFDAGTDVEDAKEALEENKKFYGAGYKKLVDDARRAEKEEQERRKQATEDFTKSIMDAKNFLGDLEVDKATKQKIVDNALKPTYRDKETGEYLTAIQKYEMDNRLDFLRNVSLLYTLTDGFKNLDKIVGRKVRKEVNKGVRNLEKVLNNTSRNSDGSLRFVTSQRDDPEAFLGKGWKLDI